MRSLSDRARILFLVAIMVGVAVATAGVSTWFLYETALDEQRARLVEFAQSQARMIEAIARFDAVYSQTSFPDGAAAATLRQVTDAHDQYQGFGETGEFSLARRDNDEIVFLLRHRHLDLDAPKPVPWKSDIAEPMRRALSGQSGTVIGSDYRGVTVLAAYEPVAELDFGIVAKIDLAEVRRPFLSAAGLSGLGGLFILALGVIAGRRISNPMIERLEAEEALRASQERFRDFAEIASDWFWEMDENLRFTYFSGRHDEAGLEIRDTLGKTRPEVTVEDTNCQKWRDHLAELAAHKPFRGFEYAAGGHYGRVVQVSVSGKPIFDATGRFRGYRGTAADITERIKAAEELTAAKERAVAVEMQLDEALEAMSEGFIYFDAEDRFIRCNSKHRELFPSHADAMVPGMRFEDLIRKQVQNIRFSQAEGREEEWIADRVAQHRNPGGPIEQEFADGRIIRLSEYKTKSGGTVSIRTDITELKRAAEELRDSRNRMRLITDNVPVFISYVDRDQRLRFVNKTAQEWYALSPSETLGRTIREIIGPRAYDQLRTYLEAALSGTEQQFEQTRTYPDGQTRAIETSYVPHRSETGEVLGCFALVHDVTERKRAEDEIRTLNEDLERRVVERTEELRRSEMRLRDAMEALPAGFALYDRESRLAMCNEAYRQMVFRDRDSVPYGATFEEILKHNLARHHYPEAEGRETEWLAERLRVHRETPGPIEQMHSGGQWYWINERRISEGSTVVISADITERKHLESELLRQERLATLGQLTATVSHELRNPLGVIRTSAYVVREGLPDEATRARRSLERIERNVVRCDRIIDELLDFTRISEIETEPTPIDAWLEETLSEQTVPSGVSLRYDFGLGDRTATIDRDRLRRAIINVFDNACQAMLGAGQKDAGSKEHVLVVRTRARDDRIEVVLEDTGPGMTPEIRARIFEPMFSTKGFGVGLGLPVVKQIMEQHGGGIQIEGEKGRGTRVSLWLPAAG